MNPFLNPSVVLKQGLKKLFNERGFGKSYFRRIKRKGEKRAIYGRFMRGVEEGYSRVLVESS